MSKFPYSEKVLEHFRHPRNVGRIENPDGKSVEGSPACGDMVAVHISVDDETKRITDIKFESYGCASNIATGSIITEMAKDSLGDDFWAYGVAPNRRAIEALCRYSFAQGIAPRQLAPEELFAPQTLAWQSS